MTTTPATVALDTIGQIAIRATDIPRAVQFYRDTLGMRFLFEFPNLAFFDCGGTRLFLSANDGPAGDPSILDFRVDDIQAAYDELRGRGVEFEHMDARALTAFAA